ncbi:MAG TPA: hypothetical protein VKA10_12270, partial [Prolixibacteraceae bacterium]|nr:hypothetical protein [Prolixibacteraceae bacterium]
MNINKLIYSALIVFACTSILNAQNPPVFETPEKDTVIVNSGRDFVVLSNIGDGDENMQELNIEVASSNETVLQVDSVSWFQGNRLAIIWVKEKGVTETVTLTVEVNDSDGMTSKNFDVEVAAYSHHGIK